MLESVKESRFVGRRLFRIGGGDDLLLGIGESNVRIASQVAVFEHVVEKRVAVVATEPVAPVVGVAAELCDAGLNAIEVYHSDHSPARTELYLEIAARHGLLVTGGSDFHGAVKPDVELGTGRNRNLRIPEDLVERLRGA